ncbi:MAG: dihydroorotase [Deltaproteobacteria bacterium]|nr:dihydroorotase [Deltaproteobacteria bacterium]
MESILIVNALIANDGEVRCGDVFIANGRIEQVGPDLASRRAATVIDAAGRLLLPGMIDDQVHFREPGLTHKGDIFSESRAAVAGGITGFMDMPNTIPPTTTRQLLSEKFARAAGRSFANYAFYLGGANDNLEEIKALDPCEACGIKIFMGASTGNLLVDDPEALRGIFSQAPTVVATHCEDTPTIRANEERLRSRYGEAVPMSAHPEIRSAEACWRSSSLAIDLAREFDAQLHLLHLTTAREMNLLSDAPLEDKRITAEVCVHHLYFDDRHYAEQGTRIKCNPAIKTAADRKALVAAVRRNLIDVIATDHAPHTLTEKQNPYFKAPAGLPLVQHALVCVLEHYHDGLFSLPLIADKTAHAPARVFRLKERGYIREGYWADLTLVDLNRPQHVSEQSILYRCGWSPFDGLRFRSSVAATIVSGHLAFYQDHIDPLPAGTRLEIDR